MDCVNSRVNRFYWNGRSTRFFGKERFYEIAEKSEKKIGFLKAIRQAASSKPMLGLVGIVFALNFVGPSLGASHCTS